MLAAIEDDLQVQFVPRLAGEQALEIGFGARHAHAAAQAPMIYTHVRNRGALGVRSLANIV